MNDRRRFLKVLSGSMIAAGAVPLLDGCSSEGTTPTGAGGGGGGGGEGGAGATTSSSGSTSSSGQGGAGGGGCGPLPPGAACGDPAQYAVEGIYKVTGTKVIIGRDAGGLYAMSSLCTHVSCNMAGSKGLLIPEGIRCTCHGSEFDRLGHVIQGPATKNLPFFKLALGCDGFLYADTATKVTEADRLAL